MRRAPGSHRPTGSYLLLLPLRPPGTEQRPELMNGGLRRRAQSVGSLACPSKPVKRASFRVGHRQHERTLRMNLERDQVRKPSKRGLVDNRWGAVSSGPSGVRLRCFTDPGKQHGYLADELVAQASALLLVPQRSSPKLSARLRMKLDPHAAVRVPSGFLFARFPKQRSGRAPRRSLGIAAPTRSPTQQRRRRRVLRGWRVSPRPHERARGGEGATPLQRTHPLTCSQSSTDGGPWERTHGLHARRPPWRGQT